MTNPFSTRLILIYASFGLSACMNQPAANLSGQSQLHVAQAAEASGDFRLAEEMFASASSAAPTDAAIQLRYADVLVQRGKILQARDLLSRHMSVVTDKQLLGDGLGGIYVLAGESERAISQFDQQLALNPNDIRAFVNKAIALDLLGRHEQAQSLYRKALADDPNDPITLNNLALSLLLAGQSHGAAQVASALTESTNMPQRIRGSVGVVLAADGDLAGASSISGNKDYDSQILSLAKAAKSSGIPLTERR